MTPTYPYREYMPDLPHWLEWGIYIALFIIVVAFLWGLKRRVERSGTTGRQLLSGVWAALKQHPGSVVRRVLGDVFGQARVRRNPLGATFHLLIFGSFGLLFIGTMLIAIQQDLLHPLFGWEFLRGNVYLVFEFVLDTAALGLILGTLIAMWRRYVIRPKFLGGRASVHLVYAWLLYFGVTGLVLEGARLAIIPVPWAHWSYAGNLVSKAVEALAGSHLLGFYQTFWALHVIGVFVFLAMLPLVMLDHIVILPLNMTLQDSRVPGKLTTPFDLPKLVEEEADLENLTAGVASPIALGWQRRFMLDACIDCGRCEAVCPANAAGRQLSPRLLIQALGKDLRASVAAGSVPESDLFTREVLAEATAWSCLTCGACARECPALIDHPGTVVELRRHLVEEGRVEERQAGVLEALERNQNPLGMPSYQRSEWMAGLDVPTLADNPEPEYLYWIGCMASYDPRVRSVAQSMVKILKHAGVSFAVIGDEERCCGEPQRKVGDEAGFQMRAVENLTLFESCKKVLTHCPHCLATFTKDYPDFGGDLEVVHHSVLLAELIAAGRVPAPMAAEVGKLTYHDPCNLGRLGGVFDPPRAVCQAVAGSAFIEMDKVKDRSFCCGGGGANYFYKVPEECSVSSLRLAQATQTGADTLATACPFCLGMLEDAARSATTVGEDGNPSTNPPRIADLAELVAAGIPGGDAGVEA